MNSQTERGAEPRRFKWGGSPFQVDQATADEAFAAVEGAFGKAWLEKGRESRVQAVWAREDFLAGLELFSLGRALQRLTRVDRQKVMDLVRAVRKGGQTAHGFLYEIQALAMLAEGGHEVTATHKAAPGCDAYVKFPNGMTMRWSLKNHDQSEREGVFRARSERLYADLRKYARGGALDRLLVSADKPMEGDDFGAISESLHRMPRERWISIRPALGVTLNRIAHVEGQAPFATDSISAQLTVIAQQHPSEQRNFASKLRKAADNMMRHCPRQDGFSNVLMMRLHATADLTALRRIASELVAEPGCAIDAVVLHQPSVTRAKESWSILQHMQMVVGPEYPKNCPLRIALPAGLVSTTHSPTILRMDQHEFEMEGKYFFQKGVYVREAQAGPDGGHVGNLGAVADGIREDVVFTIGGGRHRISARHPESDELLLI